MGDQSQLIEIWIGQLSVCLKHKPSINGSRDWLFLALVFLNCKNKNRPGLIICLTNHQYIYLYCSATNIEYATHNNK